MAAALAAGLAFSGCREKIEPGNTPAKETRVIRAPVAVVETASRAEQYEAMATVAAKVHADLSSKLMGAVQEVRVEEGDAVKQGDILVVMDSRQVSARLEQMQAGLEEARRAEASAESARDAAQAAAQLARITYDRFQRLLKEDSATRQEFDEVEARHRQSQAALAQSQAMLAAAQNRVQQSEAVVRAAAVSQKDALIRAPYDGRITRKRVHPGDLASPGTPLLALEKTGSFRAELVLPEKYMREVKTGQRVSVAVPALGAFLFEGVIAQVTPSADAKSRSFQVKVDLPEHESLRSGMFARVALPLGVSGGMAIPKKAVVPQGQLSGIFVIDASGTARFRLVRTGKETGESIEILSGLKEGMRFVADPPPDLEDGMKVEAPS